jgi:hypothetical protein
MEYALSKSKLSANKPNTSGMENACLALFSIASNISRLQGIARRARKGTEFGIRTDVKLSAPMTVNFRDGLLRMDFALWRTSGVTMLILMDTATIVKRDFIPFTANATRSMSIFESVSPRIID